MSANLKLHSCILLWLAAMAWQGACAREWKEIATTPFVDPLFTKPLQLSTDLILPGDTQAHTCHTRDFDNIQVLTLLSALNLALCHNPRVQSAWIAIKTQAALVGEARAAYFPVVNLGLSRLNQKTRQQELNFQVNTRRRSNTQSVIVTWRLLDFGERGANRRAANALLNAALSEHEAALQQIATNVIGLYLDTQTAKASLDAQQKNAQLAQKTVTVAQKRKAYGAGSRLDVLQARTSLARAELENTRALGAYEKSLVVLVVALGLPVQTFRPKNIILAQDYLDESYSLQENLTVWLELARQHPTISAAQAQLDAAKERLIATRSESLPTLDASYSRFVNGRPDQGLLSTQTKETTIRLSLNIPLFEGFGYTYRVRGAQIQVEAQEVQLEEVKNRVLAEVTSAYTDAMVASRNLKFSKRLIDTAQNTVTNVQRKYDQGVANILEMLGAQAELANAEQERIRSLAEWRFARLVLLANSGAIGFEDVR